MGDAARDCYQEFKASIRQDMANNPETADYLKRCAETAVRLATIRAAGRWAHGAAVDLSDIEWGAGIAWTTMHATAVRMLDFLPHNERSQMTAKIAGYIRRHGPVKIRNIQQLLKGRLRSQEIKDILAQLVEAGEIVKAGDEYRLSG
jgi:hypothetical protein